MVSQSQPTPYIPEPLIKQAARRLIGWYRLTESDREEIEQFLRLRIVQAWPKFDPRKSQPRTFADRIVKAAIPSFIRDRTRLKRNPSRVEGTLESCGYEPVTDRNYADRIDLEVDTRFGLEKLTSADRAFATLIMDYGLAHALRHAQMTPDQAEAALKRIRDVWESLDLNQYTPGRWEPN